MLHRLNLHRQHEHKNQSLFKTPTEYPKLLPQRRRNWEKKGRERCCKFQIGGETTSRMDLLYARCLLLGVKSREVVSKNSFSMRLDTANFVEN